MDEYARLYRRREDQRRRRRRNRISTLLVVVGLAGAGYIASQAFDKSGASSETSLTKQGEVDQTAQQSTPVSRPTIPDRQGTARTPTARVLTRTNRSSFRALEAELGGASGVALSAVGLDPKVEVAGSLQEEVAWSTIKVPIALAIESRAQGQPTPADRSWMTPAITASDNTAAEALWSRLGVPSAAGAAVQEILRSAGDTSTQVETRVLRPGFSASGQTQWSLAAQARFIAALPCLPYAESVLSLMGQIVPEQRWGLGSLGVPAQFKGGWGPGLDGHYLVRQMGILKLPTGRLLAVSIATNAADGSFSTGTASLTRIARWTLDHVGVATIPQADCTR
jgi:hypothetical protein